MLEIRNDLHVVILVYIVICVLIWKMKPKFMFGVDGNMKNFGIGYNKSIFAYPITVIILAILMFYIYEIILLYKANLV
jgi:hypothetical protein